MSDSVEAFFYGLYMDPELLESLGFRPGTVKKAKMDSYTVDLFGAAKIVPKAGSVVWGNIIRLSEPDLKAMYSFDATKAYSPQMIQVTEADGKFATATCYNLPESNNNPFNSEYHEKLIHVLKKLEFPSEYIDSVKALGESS